MEPSAWVLWQVIDTHVSKEGYKGRVDKGPLQTMGGYWGTAYANHDTEEIVLTQKYYAFGHFSKYIRPGSSLIICNNGLNRGCNAIAAIDNKGKQITVVSPTPLLTTRIWISTLAISIVVNQKSHISAPAALWLMENNGML